MYIKLKHARGGFNEGDIVKAQYAHNLPRENRAPAGYWLLEGKAPNGVKWKDHAIGCLIPFNDATITEISKKESDEEDKLDAHEYLHTILKPGSIVYTKCTHVSASGMSRSIHTYIARISDEGKPYIENITWAVKRLCGYTSHNDNGLKVGGCGMDSGFSVVYSLASRMYGRGDTCAAYKFISSRSRFNGTPDAYETDGGYMLTQQWL